MSKEKGFIFLFRDIKDHWLWKDKPFARGQAFIDLVFKASHKPNKMVFNGQIVNIERGEFITSIAKLSTEWGWSRHKTKDFLDALANDNIITLKSDNKKTTIKVLKYDVYQGSEKTKRTSKGHQKDIKRTQSINNLSKERLLESKEEKVGGDPKGYTDF